MSTDSNQNPRASERGSSQKLETDYAKDMSDFDSEIGKMVFKAAIGFGIFFGCFLLYLITV